MNYPFQTSQYRQLFKKHFPPSQQEDSLYGTVEFEILSDKRAVLLGMKHVLNNQEITDYGDIDKDYPLEEIHESLKSKGAIDVQYDYIREHSAAFKTLMTLSSTPPEIQEVAPYIALPSTWDSYLESLERTDRKELKRKWKRLETVPHEFKILESSVTDDDFELFIKLHKLSDHSKEQFMTDPMKEFFRELIALQIPGWKQKLAFLSIEGKPAAAIFYFETDTELLLYNSGYDPAQKFYSVGLLLTAHLIRKSIEEHKKNFDFLRGNERYKYDLGGKDERLYRFVFHLTKSMSA